MPPTGDMSIVELADGTALIMREMRAPEIGQQNSCQQGTTRLPAIPAASMKARPAKTTVAGSGVDVAAVTFIVPPPRVGKKVVLALLE
jgi:hypothetical protein